MHSVQRIADALAETNRLLARELSYSVDLQYPARIAFYEAHAVNLEAMLAGFPVLRPAVADAAGWDVARCVLDAMAAA